MIYRMFLMSIIIPFFFSLQVELRPDLKDPVNPYDPDVKFRNAKKKHHCFKAIIEFANGKKAKGRIYFFSNRIAFHFLYKGSPVKREELISNISSLEIIKWKGRQLNKKSYIFSPESIRLTLTDGALFKTVGNITELNRIRFKASKKEIYIYTIFYDYRFNDIWKNSNKKDMKYPETNPLPGAVVKIILNGRCPD